MSDANDNRFYREPQPSSKDLNYAERFDACKTLEEAREVLYDMSVEIEQMHLVIEDREQNAAARASSEPCLTLAACPYCKQPADADGGINHVPYCAGLEEVKLIRLQYDALRATQPPCDVTADAARLRAYFNNANCISHPSLFYSSANPFASWCESIDQYMQERASVTNPAQPPPVAHSKSQQKRFVEMQQADAPPCVHPFAKLGIDADGVMWCVDCLKKPLVIPVPFGDETPQPPSAEHAWAYELFDIREDCARYGTPVEVVIVAPPSSAGTKGDAQ